MNRRLCIEAERQRRLNMVVIIGRVRGVGSPLACSMESATGARLSAALHQRGLLRLNCHLCASRTTAESVGAWDYQNKAITSITEKASSAGTEDAIRGAQVKDYYLPKIEWVRLPITVIVVLSLSVITSVPVVDVSAVNTSLLIGLAP